MLEQLPMGWKKRTLGEIAEIVGGGTPSRSRPEFFTGDIPWATPTDITALDGYFLYDTKGHITQEAVENSSARLLSEGTVLLTSRATIGSVAIAMKPMCTNQGFANFICGPEVQNRYLAWFLRSSASYLKSLGGTTTFPEISKSTLRSVPIIYPADLTQQQRIADLLDEVDAARRLCDQIQQEIERFTSALFIAMFGDPETNPKEWEVISLGDKDCVVGFTYGTNMRSTEQPIGTPILRIPNILRGSIDTEGLKYADLPVRERQKLTLQPGDVLVVRSNGNPSYIGRGAAYQESPPQAAFASYLIRIRPVPTAFDGEYLSAWLRSSNGRRQLLDQAKTTAGQYNLSTEGLRQLRVPKPPLTLQKKFVAILNDVRSSQQIQRAIYEALNEMLHTLLGTLFAERSPVIVVPAQSQIAIDRIIWPKLSVTQRNLWTACETLTTSFKVEELREQVVVQQGKAPSSEYTLNAMELLEVLAVTIKENRGDVEKWRLPDNDTDPDIEV